VRFLSGSGGNKFVSQVVDGQIYFTVTKQVWQQSFKQILQKHWKVFLGIFLVVAGGSVCAFVPPVGVAMIKAGFALSCSDVSSSASIVADVVYRLTA
jgi:hypothetical protein